MPWLYIPLIIGTTVPRFHNLRILHVHVRTYDVRTYVRTYVRACVRIHVILVSMCVFCVCVVCVCCVCVCVCVWCWCAHVILYAKSLIVIAQLTEDNADEFVKTNVDAGKTVYVRWVASAG